jgi:hypothetical protein
MMSNNIDDFISRNKQRPPANNDFASRIIIAASHIDQKTSIWNSISRIFEELKVPAPAYSFASLMLVGFVAGFMNYSVTLSPDDYVLGQLLYEYEDSL